MTAQPKPTATEVTTGVLREFSGRRSYADVADLVVRSLAAAGLLATADHDAEVLDEFVDQLADVERIAQAREQVNATDGYAPVGWAEAFLVALGLKR